MFAQLLLIRNLISTPMAIPLLLMIIVIQRLSLRIVVGQETFDCRDYEDDSVHPQRNDCQSYWQCIIDETMDMKAVKRMCPPQTAFDSQTKQCKTASLVDCTPSQKQSKSDLSNTFPILKNLLTRYYDSVPNEDNAHHRRRDRNFTLNILTSDAHRIRPFSINKTRGLLIQCNEIRRRQFRDFLFRTTAKSLMSSAIIPSSDLLSLISFFFGVCCFFYKNK